MVGKLQSKMGDGDVLPAWLCNWRQSLHKNSGHSQFDVYDKWLVQKAPVARRIPALWTASKIDSSDLEAELYTKLPYSLLV